MKHQARRLFIADLQNSSAVVSISVTNFVMIGPSTAVNSKNIDTVRHMIETDMFVIYHEIEASLGISSKIDRYIWCNAMLTRFKERASNLVWDIATDDETLVYCYDFKTKQKSTVWVYQNEPKPTKAVLERSASKKMELDTWYCCFG
ncbi:hypothetical protein EVAR_38458_1 [Eumeta japonica]|uniref:Mariner Mos1 transposase n=1 Tax=Eumeta variegata TaxID=151549 RepID=A0A4C1WP61_EUMVA|nr:hypothetical protein EVAR_38458_1 [Eumeta japonica]